MQRVSLVNMNKTIWKVVHIHTKKSLKENPFLCNLDLKGSNKTAELERMYKATLKAKTMH